MLPIAGWTDWAIFVDTQGFPGSVKGYKKFEIFFQGQRRAIQLVHI